MKITYIELNNFASIYSGMGLRNLKIDLSKCKNRIVLLLGENGSGKTSLLSNLHPFAFPGNMDVRNSGDLILEDCDGYKEIHLKKYDDEYIIKHQYKKSSTGRTIKSYIIKNKLELNGNGNVTSFKDILISEFGLDIEFLKLLRLGSNVSSLITMKTTDRKKFSSNLLSDVDIYTDLYKKINMDYRLLSSKIKSVSDKINKLKIDDENSAKDRLEELQGKLESLSKSKENILLSRGTIIGKINSLYNGTIIDLDKDIDNSKTVLVDLNKQNKKFMTHIQSSKFNLNEIDKFTKKFTKELNKLNQDLAVISSKIDMTSIELNSLFEQKATKENDLKFIDSETHISNLNNMKTMLEDEIYDLKKSLLNFDIKNASSKEETLMVINTLNEIRRNVIDILSLDVKNELSEFLKLISNHVNIESAIGKKVKVTEESILIKNMKLSKESTDDVGKNDLKVLFQLCDRDDCPFVQYYKETTSELQTDKDKLQKEINKLDANRTYFLNIIEMGKCYSIIKYVFNMNSEAIKKSVCKDVINIALVNKALQEKTTTYIDKIIDTLTLYITFIEDSVELKEKELKLEDIDKEIRMIQNNSKSLDLLKTDLNNILNKMNQTNEDIYTFRNSKSLIEQDILDVQLSLDELNNISEYNEKIDSNTLLINKVSDDIQKLTDIKTQIQDEYYKKVELEKQESVVSEQLRFYTNQRDDLTYALKEHAQLRKELDHLYLKYDDIDILKKSLSNDKGMPLLLMQLYLKNARKNVNELLSLVYGETLELENFIINENEFRIPYSKNGLIVDDVIRASQGETSFISLALSLSLIEQSVKDYNVLLLDEIDSTLDQEARPIFLFILEKYLDKIEAEQVFVITHNNAYDNCDVDLICTSKNVQIDNFKNVNIIFTV